MNVMRQQCRNLGEVKLPDGSSRCLLIQENAVEVQFNPMNHHVITNDRGYSSRTVIIATGATAKTLDIPNADIYWNHGISACAVCDGALPIFRNKRLVVIGGEDIACEEALFLSRFGSKVYMFVRGSQMRASHRMQHKIMSNNKIEICYNTQVTDVIGTVNDNKKTLAGIKVINQSESYNLEISGYFMLLATFQILDS